MRLRDIFNTDSERFKQQYNRLIEMEIENKSCIICKKAEFKDHYEHGNYAGKDTWCTVTGDLRFGKNGEQCLFWEIDEAKIERM